MINPAFPELFSTGGGFITPWFPLNTILTFRKAKTSICLELHQRQMYLFGIAPHCTLHQRQIQNRSYFCILGEVIACEWITQDLYRTWWSAHTLYIISIVCFCTMLYKAIIFATIVTATNSPRKSLQYLRGAIYVQCKPCKLFWCTSSGCNLFINLMYETNIQLFIFVWKSVPMRPLSYL